MPDDNDDYDFNFGGEEQQDSPSSAPASEGGADAELPGDPGSDAEATGDDTESEQDSEPELNYEKAGKSDMRKAYEKLQAFREGDSEAREDIEDASRRWRILTYLRPDVKKAAVETTIPLSLTIYSILVAFFLLAMNPESDAVLYLTSDNRIGDLFLMDIVLIGFFATMFVVGPWVSRKAELNFSPGVRRAIRAGVIAFQLIPVAILTVFLGATFSGEDVARRGYILYLETIAKYKPKAPDFIVSIGEWYYSVSPIGISASDLLWVMFVAGVLFAIPYLYKLAKAAIYVLASEPDDFPDIQLEADDIVDDPDPDPDPVDAAQFQREPTKQEQHDLDYSGIEDLLEVPDEMRMQPYPDYEEVQRYWVRAPYAMVSIVHDEEQGDYRYYVVEPEIEEGEEELILEEFNERLSTTLLFKHIDDDYEPEEAEQAKVEVIEQEVLRLANEYNIDATEETFHKLLYYIERDYVYYGKIDPLMRDPNVEDISCDGDDVPLFVFHRHYNDLLSNVSFKKQELRQFIIELAQRSGEHISAAKPLLDASLPDGSRIQMSLGNEITTRGSTFTIRLFQDVPFTPVDLIDTHTFSLRQMAYLWMAIEHDKSLIFAGGTASGKTTSMNAISLFIPPKAKVITIEDTREISLPHENWIPGVTRDGFGEEGAGEISMFNLLKSALRQRPEYMVVGEIRGEEAESLFQAMSTGHTTYSTMHADTVESAIHRLTNPPINVPRRMIQALDIMCIQNQFRIEDPETGDIKNVRRNQFTEEIVEVGETIRTNRPFYHDAEMDEFRENLEESHVLDEIRMEQGLSRDEVYEELEKREKVLQYLLDNDIRDVEDVTRTIQAYMLNSRKVLEAVENDTLEPKQFKDITEVEYSLPDEDLAGGDGYSPLYDDNDGVDEQVGGEGGVEDGYQGLTDEPKTASSDEDDEGW